MLPPSIQLRRRCEQNRGMGCVRDKNSCKFAIGWERWSGVSEVLSSLLPDSKQWSHSKELFEWTRSAAATSAQTAPNNAADTERNRGNASRTLSVIRQRGSPSELLWKVVFDEELKKAACFEMNWLPTKVSDSFAKGTPPMIHGNSSTATVRRQQTQPGRTIPRTWARSGIPCPRFFERALSRCSVQPLKAKWPTTSRQEMASSMKQVAGWSSATEVCRRGK